MRTQYVFFLNKGELAAFWPPCLPHEIGMKGAGQCTAVFFWAFPICSFPHPKHNKPPCPTNAPSDWKVCPPNVHCAFGGRGLPSEELPSRPKVLLRPAAESGTTDVDPSVRATSETEDGARARPVNLHQGRLGPGGGVCSRDNSFVRSFVCCLNVRLLCATRC